MGSGQRQRPSYLARLVILGAPDNRLFINGCLWVLRSGAHWRDLRDRYGKWKTLDKCFSRRCLAGIWDQAGRLTTKIHMLVDALGRPLCFIVTAGQVGDITKAPALLEGQASNAVLADKAYDSNALRENIANMGAETVIPSNRRRKIITPHDAAAYKHRNKIERCFN